MASFNHDGVTLAFDDIQPPGPAERTIVLVHGFASNRHEGWRRTGWYGAFGRRGVRCVALDLRGHGESQKPHDPALYGQGALAGDVMGLIDHLGLGRVDLFGFSMGARVALAAASAAPERFSNLILGGVGERLLDDDAPPTGAADAMAQAMLAEDPAQIEDLLLRSFRHFAEEQGEDRAALAAASRARNRSVSPKALGAVSMPVLVVAGQQDDLAGDPEALARAFPEAYGVSIPGCDHFALVTHALAKAAVFDFLDGMMDPDMPRGFGGR